MINILIALCTGAGAVAILLAAIGLLRMPDLYLRLSVTTKAATLGIGLILVGGAFHFQEVGVTSRVLAIIFFITLTGPVSAQLIGRVAYLVKAKMWEHTITDELDGRYDSESHTLESDLKSDENDTPKP
ncbi:monovalent cation/H(+) antiporter subunit G [Segetibacter sp. 3557_3]|uniref:monovalent cation/H(+) antiporter subunit G n=1 Tax=Segetibacter sp. 3557_3 TaxID=2547429 RepID=UPI001058796C|nr:monovalent cation/H(+) antiporter subunit G [Segetibacter sp. 3557_3]TDH19960.1 monovalent cation/H(+) antiporter subunit G [Segetibacter sp. 3557_3]